jgi:hypothetical protein
MEISTRNNSDALSREEAPTPSDSAESDTLSDGSKSADDSEVSHHFQKKIELRLYYLKNWLYFFFCF